jgi:8-hydroxy-5-deazaflavin:NADPH oxidoreductase
VLATPWTSVENALAALPSWSGKTLVDATNAYKVFDPPTIELFDFGDRTSSEVVASLAPGASVVKAFNHVPFMRLLSPPPDGEQHVLFVSGDDAAAKADLRSVLEANNFAVIDLGDLATGSRLQQVGGPLGGPDLHLTAAG